MRRLLPFLFLVATQLQAQPFVVSAEHAMSPLVPPNAPGAQIEPAIATNGDGFVVVWNDQGFVAATRLDGHGRRLDARPVTLGRGIEPRIVGNGETYVVAAPTDYGCNAGVELVEIGPNLEIVRRKRIDGAENPEIAWNGSEYLLVYSRCFSPEGLLAVLLDRNLEEAAPPFRIGDGAWNVRVASNGETFLVAHAHEVQRRVITTVVTPGQPQQPSRIIEEAFGATKVAVASDGSGYVVAYAGNLVTLDGEGWILGRAPIQAQYLGINQPVALAWDGWRYVLVLEMTLQALSTKLKVISETDPFHVHVAALATNGSNLLLVWDEKYGAQIRRQIVPRSLHRGRFDYLPDSIIADAACSQYPLSGVFTGRAVTSLWLACEWSVRLGRMAVDGTSVDSEGVAIGESLAYDAAVAWNGRQHLVVSATFGSSVLLHLVSEDLREISLLKAFKVYSTAVSVASNGQDFFVTWQRCNGSIVCNTHGVVVKADGSVSEPSDYGAGFGETMLWTGSEYVTLVQLGGSRYGLRRFDSSGEAVATVDWNRNFRDARLATSGRDLLLVGTDSSNVIHGQRYALDGTLLGQPLALPGTGEHARWATVGWDGVSYVVAHATWPEETALVLSRVFATYGGLAASGPTRVSMPYTMIPTQVVPLGPGRSALAYVRSSHPGLRFNSQRLFLRFIEGATARTRAVRR